MKLTDESGTWLCGFPGQWWLDISIQRFSAAELREAGWYWTKDEESWVGPFPTFRAAREAFAKARKAKGRHA